MASFKAKEIPIPSPLTIFSLVQLYVLFFLIPSVKTTSFNYPSFGSNLHNIILQGDAASTPNGIELTTNQINRALDGSVGRALYADPVRLWDSTTGQVADFMTHFSFVIEQTMDIGADGLVFFLAPNGSDIPPAGGGAYLGVMSNTTIYDASMENPVVAVEFDTFPNDWDPPLDHIGIDINSIKSAVTLVVDLKVNDTANVWVSYNSSTKNLSVYLTHDEYPQFNGESLLSYGVDLKQILPEWVNVGFSATTGSVFELHSLHSWEFNSTEFPVMETEASLPAPSTDPTDTGIGGRGKRKIDLGLVIGLVVSILFITAVVGLILFVLRKKSNGGKDDTIKEMSSDGDYESGTGGPRRFAYGELVRATNNFANGGKLGEGGFGGVYKGILSDTNVEVAVKKVSKGSRQGKKEYISEVKIISQLRHRNLVQLLGWCHELGELLLVYEYMPNGSLDFHLFGGRTILTWLLRYKIALGLASALLYLHEQWEQCVVHRDIKSSNIMLDSSFNAKLGDFGLARFVDHDVGVKTTMLAGTMGYMAPECHATGKAGKESDVYSFGVVALEIVSGRRVVEPKEEASKVGLISWVWGLYGSGKLLEAADSKLGMDFNEQQIERLLIVGLWCANLDYNLRPSIKQAIAVLNFDAPLPYLPLKMSVPTHIISSLHDLGLSYPSSSSGTENQGNQSQASYGSHSTNSTNLSSSSSLLHQESR